MSVPFDVPARFLASYHTGEIVRYGAILKEAGTGKIVGHLQETGLLQKALQTGLSFDPTGVTGIVGVAQNAAIASKLNTLQTMMGTLQTLQIATLATSVVGIGVTAASTAIILKRLGEIETVIKSVEERIVSLPSEWREMNLKNHLVTLRSALEKLQESEVRSDKDRLIADVEDELRYVFDQLHHGTCSVVIETKVDGELLRTLLAGLALCGSAQIKSLIWLDMKEAAEHRSRLQFAKFQDLAFLMPRDMMAERLTGGSDEARRISEYSSELRARIASQPELARTLIARDIHGREYIERASQELDEPILLLQSSQNALRTA